MAWIKKTPKRTEQQLRKAYTLLQLCCIVVRENLLNMDPHIICNMKEIL